ncbi:MAG TPA: hypothetical protein VGA68_11130, partial [Woeseiaceae bacterium]
MTSLLPIADALRYLWPRTVDPGASDYESIELIRDRATPMRRLADRAIRQQAAELRSAVQSGANPTERRILIPAFALVLEAARRMIGVDLYDVQLLAGLALARPAIAEMRTGEGKTFAATAPAFLHALCGKGVHVMTVNDYLAGRDYALLSPVYRLLGVSIGLLEVGGSPADTQAAYACDITYGPGYEFGFDYLRDQATLLMRRKPKLGESYLRLLQGHEIERPQSRQRGHAVAIVDEIDSVLLDEATTPLVLSGASPDLAGNADIYQAAAGAARQLVHDLDYIVDIPSRQLHLTPLGKQTVG